MRLNELTIKNFRNYENQSLTFSGNLILFLGENAEGKTNLLESIYVAAMTRSHRTNNEQELIRWDQAQARSEEHTSELQSRFDLVCRLLLESSANHLNLYSFPTRRSSDLNQKLSKL